MNEHTAIGGAILGNSKSRLMRLASDIAEAHHERWDGSGYPRGLAGEAIPIVGRIAAVADVFDALTTERPYKAAWPIDHAFNYLKEKAGSEFDPACVKALCRARAQVSSVVPEPDVLETTAA